ncbi:MAG TPA: hypothetical protein VHG08_11730 [Longimicrobium sp.]|nr:hypothetical protein [Longimicrobium sp.]
MTVAPTPPDAPDPRESELCEELLAYLREHPRAMDSLEGIAEWWLPRHHIRVGVERIARALETLTRRGMLQEVEDGDRMLYRLRPDPGPDRSGGGDPPAGPDEPPA